MELTMAVLNGHLTVREAAEELGVSTSYVCRLIERGRLKAMRLGDRLLLVDAVAVRKFRRQPRGRPPSKKAPKTERERDSL